MPEDRVRENRVRDDTVSGADPPGATAGTSVLDVGTGAGRREDVVAVEEPLELRVVADTAEGRTAHSVAVTMRTPGDDFALVAGFLLSEGIVTRPGDLWRLSRCERSAEEEADNIVEAHLAPGVVFDEQRFSRHVYTTSSCGVCGKASIELLSTACPARPAPGPTMRAAVVQQLPDRLRRAQTVFARTGGLHAAGLFDAGGSLLAVKEDVGRHNALDKLLGERFLADETPLRDVAVLVSGRTSFELVQKALMAGVGVLLSVGAPSSLAVDTARDFGMTLAGFVKAEGFNVYCGAERIS